MSPLSKTYRQLQPEDRVTLASLKQQNYSVLEIAIVLGCLASAISCELHRNASAGHYASVTPSGTDSIGASSPSRCVNCTPTRSCLASCSICCDSAGHAFTEQLAVVLEILIRQCIYQYKFFLKCCVVVMNS